METFLITLGSLSFLSAFIFFIIFIVRAIKKKKNKRQAGFIALVSLVILFTASIISSHLYPVEGKESRLNQGTSEDSWEWLVEPLFDNKGIFSEGLASVKVNDKWGYIDISGDWIIEPRFNNAYSFLQGKAGATILVDDTVALGFIDKTGLWVIQPQFKSKSKYNSTVPDFIRRSMSSTGEWLITEATLNGKECFVGSNGNFVEISGNNENIKDEISRLNFNNNRKIYIDANPTPHFFMIDNKMENIFDGDFENVFTDFSEGLVKAHNKTTNGWGFINEQGRWIILPLFREAMDFSDGLAATKKDNYSKWGFINKTGKWQIQPSFSNVHSFSDGLASVESDGKFGFIDTTGTFVIKPQYYKVQSFSEGMALVQKREKGKWGYIGKNGEFVIKAQFDEAENFQNGITFVKIKDKWGLIKLK